MESSAKQRSFRSKSFGQRPGSVRRKQSFNKVRQQFENNDKSVEQSKRLIKKRIDSSSTLKTTKKLNEKFDSLAVIEEKHLNNCPNESISSGSLLSSDVLRRSSLPSTGPKSVVDLCLVKNKINFFEEKTSNNLQIKSNIKNNSTKIESNSTNDMTNDTNYGNSDIKQTLIEWNIDNEVYESMSAAIDANPHTDSNDYSNEKSFLNHLRRTETKKVLTFDDQLLLGSTLTRSLSNRSDTSISSDFVSFDNESEIVFRKPLLKTNVENIKVKPIPKQRTSLNKTQTEDKSISESLRSDPNETIAVRSGTDLPKPDAKRVSSLSQDSGISDMSQNSSYLWQSNKNTSESDENNTPINESKTNDQIQGNSGQTEEIDEHLYEELSHFRTASPNEWIDIESDDKNNIQNEAIVKRPQSLRINNIYRKSYRPKHPNKRKSHRRLSIIKLASGGESASATEYEDIDDEDFDDIQSIHSIQSRKSIQSSKSIRSRSGTLTPNTPLPPIPSNESVVKQLVSERLSQHIYEFLPGLEDSHEIKKTSSTSDLKDALNREMSVKSMDKSKDETNTSDKEGNRLVELRSQSQPNIYSSWPRRTPKFETNLMAVNEKNGGFLNSTRNRDSISSRNSSIYISPNCSQSDYMNNRPLLSPNIQNTNAVPIPPNRTDLYQKQYSVTASIASYLEFNTSDTNSESPFNCEPLYQFYQKDVRRRAELWIHYDQKNTELDYDDYEDNSIYGTTLCRPTTPEIRRLPSDNQLSADRIKSIFYKRNKSPMDLVGTGPNRTLWCQLPQVINSKDNLLSTLSAKERRLQESMFEIITSEASYCKSLHILVSHFTNCIEFNENNAQILTQRERKCLFSNVNDISKISLKLLTDLEKRFEQNILLYDICDIIYDYAVHHFQPYIHYCAYQRDQEKLLTHLTYTRPAFVDVLQRLESNQICQNQTILSFLMLPLQRITRYPLLIDAVCQQIPENSPLLESSRKTLGIVNQLVYKCNEETKKVQRMQELIEIEKLLHFRSNIKSYPIVSGRRYLVKKGSVLRLSPQMSVKRTIGKSTLKWTKRSIYLFLFSDLLILAKKKSETNYSVFDYCSRSTVQLISLNNNGVGIGLNYCIKIPQNYQNIAQLVLLHNHESKSVEYTICFDLESDKTRWIDAVSQPLSDNPNEVIYEEWDCPQVQCIRSYSAQQTDEISLEETDVLNVCRKMKDGWFEGQRIRDGMKGWFPSEYTEEIVNQHVRARNIRLRHRLLMFSQSVIDLNKRTSIDVQK